MTMLAMIGTCAGQEETWDQFGVELRDALLGGASGGGAF